MSQSPSVPPPPHYSAPTSSSAQPLEGTPVDNFFDVVPQSDATSFQVGYLGLDGFQAWVKGDVLIKLDEKLLRNRHLYERCTLSLVAEEGDKEQSIPFFSSTQTLWEHQGRSSASTSRAMTSAAVSAAVPGETSYPPSTLPFSFPLTSDLPHCIHLGSSRLEYKLVATLDSSDESLAPRASRTTLVHLTRYSRPGKLAEAQVLPHTWHVDTPTPLTVRLERTVFRRAEPITVHFAIPAPDRKVLSLNLRSVEANLYRTIDTKDGQDKQDLLLAHSGKLCRFHSTRSIILRLTLHPPFDASNMPYPHPDHDTNLSGPIFGRGGGGGCESISQETLMHRVSFFVKIMVGIRAADGVRRDVHLQKEVQILPGAAGESGTADGTIGEKRPVEEVSTSQAGPSNWTAPPSFEEAEEEEYDGYEDVGRSLSDLSEGSSGSSPADLPLPHDDEPPPTLLESRHDLQVAVEVEGVGIGMPRPVDRVEEEDYIWRPLADAIDSRTEADEELPPPALTDGPVDGSPAAVAEHSIAEGESPHRPPPYAVEGLRATPRLSVPSPDDAHPPAYPHPPQRIPFLATPHPPSYEA